jgi:hypothetical protein
MLLLLLLPLLQGVGAAAANAVKYTSVSGVNRPLQGTHTHEGIWTGTGNL